MPTIAISYRRSDSAAIVGRIFDKLVATFGRESIFIDIDNIPLGTDFREYVASALDGCNVLLAVIGRDWAGQQADGSRRIDSDSDLVRIEIETALRRGITLVPVLIDRTPMPSASELPETIRDLVYRNALEVDFGIDFHGHIDRLIRAIGHPVHSEMPSVEFGLPNIEAQVPAAVEKDNPQPEADARASTDQQVELASLLEKAQEGDAKARQGLGIMFESGSAVPQDYAKAAEWHKKAAEQNDPLSQNNLGIMYLYGRGVSQDTSQALAWLQKAANQGFAQAQQNLGVVFQDGIGVGKDRAQALAWIRKAAEQGLAEAQYRLARLLDESRASEKDLREAAEWYGKAADQGLVDAQLRLGECYRFGQGVSRDYIKAFALYSKAASPGNAVAQREVGIMYNNGWGVPRDRATAKTWYLKAAEHDEKWATSFADMEKEEKLF